MDYIFRWIQLRFLSGTQLTLFAGMTPAVEGGESREAQGSEPEQHFTADQHESTRGYGATQPPKSGIAPEMQAGLSYSAPDPAKMADRGVYHASDAMKDLYDMGDAPSCLTCGAIMVRNGSCYRCMSCGSTSGCS
jgi:ribonucleoside-diphosphate reductase alpha chain